MLSQIAACGTAIGFLLFGLATVMIIHLVSKMYNDHRHDNQ